MSAEALTYDSLVSDIQVYSERSDDVFVNQIPRFVMLAENRIASETRQLGSQQQVTGSLTTNVLPKPERWRETISFRVTTPTGNVFLQPRTTDYCRAYDSDSVPGTPRYYADYGYEHFLITPSPVGAFDFELSYYERPEPLSASQQTSWFTQYTPQLLLYATLLECQPFLKRPERMAEFQSLYERALQDLGQESNRRVTADRAASARNGE